MELSDDDRSLLQQKLGDQPLAMLLATAYIRQVGCSVDEFVSQVRVHQDTSLFSNQSDLSGVLPVLVYLSFHEVQSIDPRSTDILSMMSVLEEGDIPEAILVRTDELPRRFHVATRRLREFALIQISEDETTLRLEAEVQMFMQDELRRQGILTFWEQEALGMLSKLFPFGEASYWRICNTLMPHVNKVLDYTVSELADGSVGMHRAQLLRNLASFMENQGNFKAASEQLEEVFALYRSNPHVGPNNRLTLAVEEKIVQMLVHREEFDEAERRARSLLARMRDIFKEDHPYHLDALGLANTLASILHRQGKYKQAEALYKEALEATAAFHYDQHIDCQHMRNNLAGLYVDMGKYTEAQSLHEQVLAEQERILGPEHHETVYTLRLLARAIKYQGRYAEAAEKNKKALALAEPVLGSKHPDTLSIKNDLAILSSDLGDYLEAEKWHREVLACRLEAFSADNPGDEAVVDEKVSVIGSRLSLAVALEKQGKYDDAVAILDKAVDPATRSLGDGHPTTMKVRNTLGLIYLRQGNFAEAETIIAPLLAATAELYGPDHHQTLIIQNNLGGCLQRQRRWDEAIRLHRVTMTSAATTLGATHPFSLRSKNNVAEVLREMAEAQLKEENPEHGRGNEMQKVLEEARVLQEQALQGRREVFGNDHPDHPDILTSCFNLGQVMQAQNHHQEALKLYQEALDGFLRSGKMDNPVAKSCQEKITVVNRELGYE